MKRWVAWLFLIGGVASAADLTWVRGAGSSGGETAYAVATDAAGNVYSAGRFAGSADFDPGPGVFNLTPTGPNGLYVQKLDADGNFVWAVALSGPAGPNVRDLALDAAGSVYLAGSFAATVDFDPGPGVSNLTSTALSDAFLLKLDAAGGFAWAVRWGGSSNDAADAVAAATDGSVYVGGNFQNTVDFDPGTGTTSLAAVASVDAYVSKFTSAGAFAWVRQFGSFGVDQTTRLGTDADGDPIVVGNFQGTIDFDGGPGVTSLASAGDFDVFVCKLATDGTLVWARRVGGFTTDLSTGIAIDAADGVRVSGYFGGTADFDPGPGNVDLTSAGSADAFVVQLDSNGDYEWAHRIGGTGYDLGLAVAVSSDGRVFVGGSFEGTVDFDPGPGNDDRTATGNQPEGFLVEYDGLGSYVDAYLIVGSGYEDLVDLAVDAADSIVGTGGFTGGPDFDPGPGFSFLSSLGSTDVYVIKLGAAGAAVPDLSAVELGSVAARQAGVAGTVYVLGAAVEGDAALLDASLTPPGGSAVPMTFDPLESAFLFESGFYASLAELRAAYPLGTYRFEFNGGSLSVDLTYSETEPACFADVVYPLPGAVTALTPTFVWDLPAGCAAGATDVGLDIAATDSEIVGLSFVPASAGSFVYPGGPVNPAPVDPPPPLSALTDGESYRIGVDVVDGTFTTEFLNGDAFDYFTSFRNDFDVTFSASGVGPVMSVTFDGSGLTWSGAPGTTLFDVVRGDLDTLRDTGFAAATAACIAEDLAATTLPSGADPASGTTWWYLIRDATGAVQGSYSSAGTGETAGRDSGIAASGRDCN